MSCCEVRWQGEQVMRKTILAAILVCCAVLHGPLASAANEAAGACSIQQCPPKGTCKKARRDCLALAADEDAKRACVRTFRACVTSRKECLKSCRDAA